jgi:hypothetical protein
MRIVQRVFLYLISLFLIVAGVAIAIYPYNNFVQELIEFIASKWIHCLLLGIVLAAFGIFTLLPFDRFTRKRRSISFSGPTGTVAIEIDPFESTLRKTIAKLPMVKRVHVTVTPKDNDRKVGIEATVALKKPGDTSTRETAERLREFIDKVARQILGADEVTSVDVRVEDVLIDPTQTAESLNSIFATAEKSVSPAPRTVTPVAAAAAPLAVAPEAQEVVGASVAETDPAQSDTAGDFAEDDAETAPNTESDSDGAQDASPSSDLLTYEEAEELEHARYKEHHPEPELTPFNDEEPKATSFQSLADETADDDESKPLEKA